MKQIVFFLIVIIFAVTYLFADAETDNFAIRNGITWGMTKEEVISAIQNEPDGINYIFSNINASDYFKNFSPENSDKLWIVEVHNIPAGNEFGEQVSLICLGSEKDGLFSVLYSAEYTANNTETAYQQIKEVEAQLEEKYNITFSAAIDNWEIQTAFGNPIFYYGIGILPDNTEIDIIAQKGAGTYYYYIDYLYDQGKIIGEIQDGIYFIDSPYPDKLE